MSPFERLKDVLLSDLTGVRMMAGWASVITGLGMLTVDDADGAWAILAKIGPTWMWGIAMLFVGVVKLTTCLWGAPAILRAVNSWAALWLWTFIFVAGVWLGGSPGPGDYLMAVFVTSEVWLLADGMRRYTSPNFWETSRD